MPRVVITHDVVDIQRWLNGKDERAAAIGAGGRNVTDYVADDGSNRIAVTVDVDDMAVLEGLRTSPPPEIAAQMESHGVLPPITVFIEK
jgi:hypothetical protein